MRRRDVYSSPPVTVKCRLQYLLPLDLDLVLHRPLFLDLDLLLQPDLPLLLLLHLGLGGLLYPYLVSGQSLLKCPLSPHW